MDVICVPSYLLCTSCGYTLYSELVPRGYGQVPHSIQAVCRTAECERRNLTFRVPLVRVEVHTV